MAERVELRVHARASSYQQGDRQYVAQAEAYLSLGAANVVRTVSLTPGIHDSGLESRDPGRSLQQTHEDSTTESGILPSGHDSYVDDTQLAYTALESQLFTSSAAIIHATPFKKSVLRLLERGPSTSRSQTPQLEPQLQDALSDVTASSGQKYGSDRTPPSQSSYLRSPMLGHSTIRGRHKRTGSFGGILREPVVSSISPGHQQQGDPWQVKTRRDSESDQHSAGGTVVSDETTSELPTSYSLSDIATDSLRDRPQLSQRSVSDPGPDIMSGQDGPEERPQPADAALHVSAMEDPDAAVVIEAPETHDRDPETTVQDSATPDEASTTLQTLPIEIHAPLPKTSVDMFVTHITKALRQLEETFANTYRPVSVSRELATHERGYWFVKCASWPPARQLAMWQLLETSIKNGSVGWGIWCTRAFDQDLLTQGAVTTKGKQPDSHHSSCGDFGPLRLYCFGEVVRHAYFLLYTVSEGGIRKAGLQWIDAAGEVVVQMRG